MNRLKQTGFTLVEIAIVLVVIGLLLGGILKGQQLINSARVRNLADQNSGVQAAYYGFIDRFRNLPGDMTPTAACTNVGAAVDTACGGTPTIGGNGDGRITTIIEAAAVWSHLSAAGFLTGTYSGTANSSATVYRNGVATGAIPPNAFQGAIMLAHANDYQEGTAAIARATVTRLGYSFGGNIPPPLLRDLDQKLDDGNAGTGVLRAAGKTGVTGASALAGITDYTVNTGEADCLLTTAPVTWNVDSANQTCNAMFLY